MNTYVTISENNHNERNTLNFLCMLTCTVHAYKFTQYASSAQVFTTNLELINGDCVRFGWSPPDKTDKYESNCESTQKTEVAVVVKKKTPKYTPIL